MKLCLSVDALAPRLTGIGRYTWELVAGLSNHDIDSIRYFARNRWVTDLAGLIDPGKGPPGPRKKSFSLTTPKWYRSMRLRSALQDRLFHGPNYFVPEYANLAIATVHDLSVFKFPETHPEARLAHFDREFHKSMTRVAHVITDSETTRTEVLEYLGWPASKITAVPLGVSPSFRPRSAEEIAECMHRYGLTGFQYGLCVSTLEPRKKIEALLHSYECLPTRLRQQYPLVLIGGAGWRSGALHAEIKRLSGQGWLRYLGFVPEDDLPLLYSGARSFFYPSIYEGFGLPVLEAMASGIPLVASNSSSLPGVTQGAALLVDPEDIDGLSVAVQRCLVDELWRHGARSLGSDVAKTYTWERCVTETVATYYKVLS